MDFTPLEMLEQVKKIVRKAGYSNPRDHQIKNAFKREEKRDPSAFDSVSGRKRVARDIADGFIARERRSASKSDLKKSELQNAGYGFEYSVLIAEYLGPLFERLRQQIWGATEAPFTTSQEAAAWLEATYETERKLLGEHPAVQWLADKERNSLPSKSRILCFKIDDRTQFGCLAPPGGSLEKLQGFCERIERSVRAWSIEAIMRHVLIDTVPGVEVRSKVVSPLKPFAAIELTIPYPATKEEVLDAYAQALPLAGWLTEGANPYPQELSEHHRRIILLVYEMPLKPEGLYTWSARLERYLELYKDDPLMPMYGLFEDDGREYKAKFSDAWRNLSRDYRVAVRRCDWSARADEKLKRGPFVMKAVRGKLQVAPASTDDKQNS